MGAVMPSRNEVHVVNAPNGHLMSVDCWCEPTYIKWMRNKNGVDVLVVEHVDSTLAHRRVVLASREHNRSLPWNPNREMGLDESWITRALQEIK